MPNPTFLDLYTIINRVVWPETIARNLIVPAVAQLKASMVDLQEAVPMLQSGQTDIKDQGATFWKCGVTLVNIPVLVVVNRVEIFQNNNDCCVVPAQGINQQRMECKVNTCLTLTPPAVGPDSDGLWQPDSTIDQATPPCEYFASIIDDVLWVYPHLASTRSIKITYTGIKRAWQDTDEVPDTWYLGTEIDPEIIDFLTWSMTAWKERCDPLKLQVALGRLADRRQAMMTSPARDKKRKLQLTTPCIPCCARLT